MPWTTADAEKHIKGLSPAQQAAWARIANNKLASCIKRGDLPRDQCEASAIRIANDKAKTVAESIDQLLDGIDEVVPGTTIRTIAEAEIREDSITDCTPLHESAGGAVLDEKNMVLRNMLFLGNRSRNGWEYSGHALESYARKAENQPVCIDHRKGVVATGRSERDYAGVSRNLHVTEAGVRGDWHYFRKVEQDIKDSLRHEAPGIGMSLSGRARFRGRGAGQGPIVEDYLAHSTTDFVAHPATVSSLAESQGTPADPPAVTPDTGRMTEMEEKALQEQIADLRAQLARKETEGGDLGKRLDKIQESLDKSDAARKTAEELAVRIGLVNESLDAAQVQATPTLRRVLERCGDKDEMCAVLKEWTTAQGAGVPMTVMPGAPGGAAPTTGEAAAQKSFNAMLDEACSTGDAPLGMSVVARRE